MKKVIDFLKNNLNNKDAVVVACSGGPDSMCLLDLVTKLKDELNLKIIVAHVNHKLRIESEEEAQMVKKYAKDNGLIFELLEINDYLEKTFTEEDARRRRYEFFNELLKKGIKMRIKRTVFLWINNSSAARAMERLFSI